MENKGSVLTRNPWPAVADLIEERGWIQGEEEDDAGHVCLHGAIRLCSLQPGDWPIVSEVAAYREHGTNWNDRAGRTADQVTGWLRNTDDIGDDELEAIYGPEWEHVIALVRRAAALTSDERQTYWNAAWARRGADVTAWESAYRAVIVYDCPGGAARRALRAVVDVVVYCAVVAAALARRSEIGDTFTQEQYDLLTGPWVEMFGPVHPEDRQAVTA